MFGIGPATRIYLAAGPTDMRKSFEGLFGLVRDRKLVERLQDRIHRLCGHGRRHQDEHAGGRGGH